MLVNKLIISPSKSVCFKKKADSDGFSIMEMSIVLTIMAITSVAGLRVLDSRMEQTAVDKIVADLTIVAEAAYGCYVADGCKENGHWKATTTPDQPANMYLCTTSLCNGNTDYLPTSFPDVYKILAAAPIDLTTNKLKIRITLPNNRLANRVAGAFGSLAPAVPATSTTVEVELGIPGTENLLSAQKEAIILEAISRTKTEIRSEDFEFMGGQRDITGVNNITVNRITIVEGATANAAEFTSNDLKVLHNLVDVRCAGKTSFITYNYSDGMFECHLP